MEKELLQKVIERYQRLGMYRSVDGRDLIFHPHVLQADEVLYHGVVVGEKKLGFTKERLADLRAKAVALGVKEPSLANLYLGSFDGTDGQMFDGRIRRLRVTQQALTLDRIKKLR